MIAVLPTWLTDGGALALYLGAAIGVAISAWAGTRHAVRSIVRPDLDDIKTQLVKTNKRIDDHMTEEQVSLNRVAYAVEAIAMFVGVKIPPIIVQGGSDEGDLPEE